MLLCAILVGFQLSQHGWLYAASDDPYIYLGYVKRTLTSPAQLFSYNPGEHSAGTTGLLYYYLLTIVCGLTRAASFSLPLEHSLLLGLYATNITLFLLAADRFLRVFYLATNQRSSVDAHAGTTVSQIVVLFALFCAHPQFLWGSFAGLENPLSSFLSLLLLERLLARAPAWQPSLVAALLCATRPETTTVLFIIPFVAPFAAAPRVAISQRIPQLIGAFAVWAGSLVVLALPCFLTTGQWLPSSLGTRVTLAPLANPGALARSIANAFRQGDYWSTEWLLYAYVCLAIALWLAALRRGRKLIGLAGVLLTFLVFRAVLGIAHFNVEDRYVSYLWPLFALVLAVGGSALWQLVREWLTPWLSAHGIAHRSRRSATIVTTLLIALCATLPIRDFLERFDRHVDLMHEIVIEPALWMRDHLPAESRIMMEPAGALRVFTDFYLIDRVGLTTTHQRDHRGDYLSFLQDNRVEYIFDRPEATRRLLKRGWAREIRAFAPDAGRWGNIRLYEVVGLPAASP